MTDPSPTDTTAPSAASLPRIGIWRDDNGVKTMLGIIKQVISPAGELTFKFQGNPQYESVVREIADVASAVLKSAKSGVSMRLSTVEDHGATWRNLTETLIDRGFRVETLPDFDIEVSLELDLRSGQIAGTWDGLHDFAGDHLDLARHVASTFENMPKELVTQMTSDIQKAVGEGRPDDVVAAINRGPNGELLMLGATDELCNALGSIDMVKLDVAQRRVVRDARFLSAVGLKRHDLAGDEATAILREQGEELTPQQRAMLEMAIATGALHRGKHETAFAMWKKLLEQPDVLGAANRGWVFWNMSASLSLEHPDAYSLAKRSADAFLQSGDRRLAGRSLARVARCLRFSKPAEALDALNEIVNWFQSEEPLERGLQAEVRIVRANHHYDLRQYSAALDDATMAAHSLDGLLGVERARIEALRLAHLAALGAGLAEDAATFRSAADELSLALRDPSIDLRSKVERLFASYDRATANTILTEAEARSDFKMAAYVRVATSTLDPTLDYPSRLSLLEEAMLSLRARRCPEDDVEPVQLAIALCMYDHGDREGSLRWYREILCINPLHPVARNNFVVALEGLERWSELSSFLEDQLKLIGEKPGILFALGNSYLKSGKANEALGALNRARKVMTTDHGLRERLRELLDRALDAGGQTPSHNASPSSAIKPVGREDFDVALEQFALTIRRDMRTRFWRSDPSGGHQWVEHPERQAQDLLNTSLQGHLGNRIDVFQEVSCGAGRLDLYVALQGGLSVVVELKMCGNGYSSSYALEGFEQVRHYMENRGTNLGYLVIFDGRIDDFGVGAPPLSCFGRQMVYTRFIDVRPTVKNRKRRGKGSTSGM